VLSALGLQAALATVCPALTGQTPATHSSALPNPLSLLGAFVTGQTQ
jgi:hypothetical protein